MRVILALMLLCSCAISADRPSAAWSLSATGTSAAKISGSSQHTVAAIPSGSPTSCAFSLEGSLDGVDWFDLSGSQTCTSSVMFHVADRLVNYVRINLTALGGGTSPTVAVKYLGVQ